MSVKRQGREEEGCNCNIDSNLGNASHVADKLQLVESDSNFSGGEKKIFSTECVLAKCLGGFCAFLFLGCYFYFLNINF